MKPPKKNYQPSVVLRVHPELLSLADLLAARRFCSRSDVIRTGLLAELERNGLCPVPVELEPA
jgi:hypothetical protein